MAGVKYFSVTFSLGKERTMKKHLLVVIVVVIAIITGTYDNSICQLAPGPQQDRLKAAYYRFLEEGDNNPHLVKGVAGESTKERFDTMLNCVDFYLALQARFGWDVEKPIGTILLNPQPHTGIQERIKAILALGKFGTEWSINVLLVHIVEENSVITRF
ncbi:hypothetical protein KKD19_04440 [Patescibacteria group bacterium]|nr:hypothetical protein [Patescibacteria group bacterium]MBU4512457.1 hypothetical protein [Patescibacteria group bacterium]